jgi:hypothetical protein
MMPVKLQNRIVRQSNLQLHICKEEKKEKLLFQKFLKLESVLY